MKQTSIKKMLALFLIAAVMFAAFTACAEKAPAPAQTPQPASAAAVPAVKVPPHSRRARASARRAHQPIRQTGWNLLGGSPARISSRRAAGRMNGHGSMGQRFS